MKESVKGAGQDGGWEDGWSAEEKRERKGKFFFLSQIVKGTLGAHSGYTEFPGH